MRVLRARIACEATIEEEWLIGVGDQDAEEALNNPRIVLDLLAGERVNVLNVTDESKDEYERDVLSVTEERLGE